MNSLQKTTFNEGSFLYFKNTLYKKIVIYLLLSVLKKKYKERKRNKNLEIWRILLMILVRIIIVRDKKQFKEKNVF